MGHALASVQQVSAKAPTEMEVRCVEGMLKVMIDNTQVLKKGVIYCTESNDKRVNIHSCFSHALCLYASW